VDDLGDHRQQPHRPSADPLAQQQSAKSSRGVERPSGIKPAV
jgi:hypothetical protein